MAVAGGTTNAFSVMRLPDGHVVVTGPHRIAGCLVHNEEKRRKRNKLLIEAKRLMYLPMGIVRNCCGRSMRKEKRNEYMSKMRLTN